MTRSPLPRITILTGAGVSAESGLGTFRDKGGMWQTHDLEALATPEGYARNPGRVLAFYNDRRAAAAEAAPNAAHHALARLVSAAPDRVHLVTQNVDDLHERAGTPTLWHMHGELMRARCSDCGRSWPETGPLDLADRCRACGAVGRLRPDVVWFGEIPRHLDEIADALSETEVFVSIGTSGAVYPAAGFVAEASRHGADTLELNLERSDVSRLFEETRLGPATELVPAWVAEILGD
ncbi:MAG: NAD-dependent deacylase [Pseudomonadota bacterium]